MLGSPSRANLNLYKHCPSLVCGVRGLGFNFGKIRSSESIVLRIGLRKFYSLVIY